MCPYVPFGFLQDLMRCYGSLCVLMGIFRFFNVVVCSYVFLWVLMGPSVSLLVLSGPYKY